MDRRRDRLITRDTIEDRMRTFVKECFGHIKMAVLDCFLQGRGSGVVYKEMEVKKTQLEAETRRGDIPLISISAGDALWSKARTDSTLPSEAAFQSGETISRKKGDGRR